ncbi:hypothetical protein GJ744_003900 [Endocarpon pusillum]|uniref:Uncharacterized protein n=1 Tax=Endocarpon pusillum TaxID=364733 RepID=A0A8H7A958_9EURO|nr:hypothetical protein GJ744_003900 [Endocarpon pusillum]
MLLSFSTCEPLRSALATSEVSRSLRILAAESLVREDIVLISLESDGRESNDLMESVSVLAVSLTSLYHHDAFPPCFEGGSGLLGSVVAASP